MYPDRILENTGWCFINEEKELFKDGVSAFPMNDNAIVRLGMPFPSFGCEVRVRSARGRGSIRFRFFLNDSLVSEQNLVAPIHYSVFKIFDGLWDSVEIVADRSVDVNFLRAVV